ncbi:MAG: TMEM43 family protein, partial [Gammaproteobacteria bacterium]|nr:TMEM43 family protein [Gammaproteobacteria bacterium]
MPGAVVLVPAAIGMALFLAACGALAWNEARVLAHGAGLGAGLGGGAAWGLRLGITLLAVLGLAVALKPLEQLAVRLPICAFVAGAGTRVVAASLGLATALLVLAAAWTPERPLAAAVAGLAAVTALGA